MCFNCSLRGCYDDNKKIEIGKYGDINSTYHFKTNREDSPSSSLDESYANVSNKEQSLESSAVHNNDRESLLSLLKSPLRKEFRRNTRYYLYYYNILRGIATMIVRKKFDEDPYIRNLYISTIVDDLQTHSFPVKIMEGYGTMNSSSDFIDVLIKLLVRYQDPYANETEKTRLYDKYLKEFTREILV